MWMDGGSRIFSGHCPSTAASVSESRTLGILSPGLLGALWRSSATAGGHPIAVPRDASAASCLAATGNSVRRIPCPTYPQRMHYSSRVSGKLFIARPIPPLATHRWSPAHRADPLLPAVSLQMNGEPTLMDLLRALTLRHLDLPHTLCDTTSCHPTQLSLKAHIQWDRLTQIAACPLIRDMRDHVITTESRCPCSPRLIKHGSHKMPIGTGI